MVPVHDTDVAEKRWNEAGWEHYELWEKTELRDRKRRRFWVAATVTLFLLISAVPILRDRGTKWAALSRIRVLGQELNRIKIESGRARAPYRIRFGEGLGFVVERLISCASPSGEKVREGNLGPGEFMILSREQGEELSVPGLTRSFCYDPFGGAEAAGGLMPLQGFGIAHSTDLIEKRSDRLAVLVLSGASAEASFD